MAPINTSQRPAILFDVGGVLIGWTDEWTFRAVSRRSGVPYPKVEGVMLEERARLHDGRLTPRQFAQAVERRLGARVPGGIEQLWSGELAAHAKVNRPLFDLADRLRSEGVPVGIFSNTDPSHVAVFHREGWFEEFRPWILSYEARASKPAASAYAWAESRVGASVPNLLLIDDRRPNVLAARERGWEAIWHRDNGRTVRAVERRFPEILSSGARVRTSRRRGALP